MRRMHRYGVTVLTLAAFGLTAGATPAGADSTSTVCSQPGKAFLASPEGWGDECQMVDDTQVGAPGYDRETFVLDPGPGSFLDRTQLLNDESRYESFGFTQNFLWYAPITQISPSPSQHWSDCYPAQYRSYLTFCSSPRATSATHTIGTDFPDGVSLDVIGYRTGDWIALSCGNWGMPVASDSPAPVIRGFVFDDANRDGIQDDGETAYGGGLTFTLSRVGSFVGQPNASNLGTVVSDANGNFSFALNNDEGPGTYRLTESYDSNWPNTTPLTQTIVVPEGADQGQTLPTAKFGVRQEIPPVAKARSERTDQTSSQGASVTLDGMQSYSPTGDPLTYSWTGPFGSTTGVTPTVLMPPGPSTVTLTVSDGIKSTATTAEIIIDRPITATPSSFSAVEGHAVTAQVATFTDPDPDASGSEYAASIDWGDGTPAATATITQPGGIGTAFVVTASHTYAEEGTYTPKVTITDTDNPFNTATVRPTAAVADAALSSTTPGTIYTTNPVNTVVASFADADPAGTVGDYTATIDWGDGTLPGTRSVSGPDGGPFMVGGSHTYPSGGPFSYIVTVHVCDVGGSCTNTKTDLLLLHMTGSAYAVQLGAQGLPTTTISDVAPVDTTAAVSPSASVLSVLQPPLVATLLSAGVTTSAGAPQGSDSRASVGSAYVAVAGLPAIAADLVSSSSDTTCAGSSGSASVGMLMIAGVVVAQGQASPNSTISVWTPLGPLTIVLNEQTRIPGGLRVNAIDISGPLGLHLVVSSATSDIHNCP